MKKLSALIFILLTYCISSPDTKKNSGTNILKNTSTEQNDLEKNDAEDLGSQINTDTDKTVKEDTKIYTIDSVDAKPYFEGGINKFQKFIRNNYYYPDEWPVINGTVETNFIVEKDSTISDISITKDAGYETGKEAIRILKKSPRWIPGIYNHKPVRVRYYLTIPLNTNHE
ncbi:hypothetical protein ASE21_03280 [Flavobacterium sp. Root901]|uniref:energy transducer TonB n=1 Tax=Flavobacterium sp. Root901 TaxID=1736605 RepID=UPI00070BF3A2|nr:energy transducer TonB [Flavobacterium sp. Root901]KRD12939.1 hypothetical protein ASE21_03280 [Flavobacterium sp. Root901]